MSIRRQYSGIEKGHAIQDEGNGASSRAAGRRGIAGPVALSIGTRYQRQSTPGNAHQSAEIQRDRLATHHSRQLEALSARFRYRHSRETGWFQPQRHSLRDVIICMDTSGSMASSVVYAGIYAAVLASLNAVTTRLVMFDTAVVDVSDQLHDPVELLFGIRLGGGTNIERAVGYCQQQVTRPHDTILILITDLYEGGDKEGLHKRVAALVADGVQVVVLLALNDQRSPALQPADCAGVG